MNQNTGRDYRFIFIVGAEGSGTTMLTRILSYPDNAVALGGKYKSIPASDESGSSLAARFNQATAALWDREATDQRYQRAKKKLPRIIDSLLRLEDYSKITHVVYKRSAPFLEGDRYRPDLSDLVRIFDSLRIVVVYRDPRASTFSAFRRGFVKNLRHGAKICEEQLTYLSAQLATLRPEHFRVISYEAFCANPSALIESLAQFCLLPNAALLEATEKEAVRSDANDRWQAELSVSERQLLVKFFNRQRQKQWPLLNGHFAIRRQGEASSANQESPTMIQKTSLSI